jgi:site-specific recombinase XerD
MLNLSRRHSATKCGKTKKRDCTCPIWVTGSLHGKKMRKSLGIRNWEAAQKLVREWESRLFGSLSVAEAWERFLADGVARGLSSESLRKYQLMDREMSALFQHRPVDSISVEDLAQYRESWKLAPISSQKKIERMRSFFKFCGERGWSEKNPAKFVRSPKAGFSPTLPFTDEEMSKILAGVDKYPDRPKGRRDQLRAFILLLRHTGLRLGDVVSLERQKIVGKTVSLTTAKTGTIVSVPVPDAIPEAISRVDNKYGDFLFWSGNGNLKSCVTDWQRTLKRLFKIAGFDGHAHRFRDTFAVNLLSRGVSLENVAVLLGHQNVKITWKHYAPWVRSRQDALTAEVRRTFAGLSW